MEMFKEAGKMLAEGAGGVVLGSACDSFLKSMEKCCMFDLPVLESVKSTVENLKAVIPKMEDHNKKLVGREDEVKELKEEMERGKRLLDELSEVSDWSLFKASYNDELVELDASLKSLVGKLHLRSATDVKEVLVSTKETGRVVKRTKRKVDEVDEKVEEIQKRQEMILNMMKKQELKDLANQAGISLEGAVLATALGDFHDILEQNRGGYWYSEFYDHYKSRLVSIFKKFENWTRENQEISYFSAFELVDFRSSITDGVDLLRNCSEIAGWTDDLKSEYTQKFQSLKKTLDALDDRLAGIQLLKWRCGSGTTSIQNSAINTTKDLIIHGN